MFSKDWDRIYGKGEQLNAYPYTEVVSFLHRYQMKDVKGIALDVGCGSGVHSELMAKIGFKVDAFDASSIVIDYARKKYFSEKAINFVYSTTENFNFLHRYDLVVDRLCTSQTGKRATKNFYDKLSNYLFDNSVLFWQGFCDDNSGRDFAQSYDATDGFWSDFTGGEFKDLGCTTFYSKDDVLEIFKNYEILEFEKVSIIDQLTNYRKNHWQVILKCKEEKKS